MRNARLKEIAKPDVINAAVAVVALVPSENTRLRIFATRIATGKWIR
jgi:hypothetical protein